MSTPNDDRSRLPGPPPPIYSSPEAGRRSVLEFILAIVGIAVFVAIPAAWIIVVTVRHFLGLRGQ